MANPPFVSGEFYHIYNRGVEKRKIFMDKRDYGRFLETLNFYRMSPLPMKLSDFRRGVIKLKKIDKQKELVRIYVYCLMPNHFHLLIQQINEGGITKFLRDLTNSYARYFNTKHKRVGPLFQGSFKAKLVDNEEYLLQLSKYIHRNAFPPARPAGGLKMWEGKVYPYSSYSQYINREKHPFCDTELILSYFSKTNPRLNYQSFVEESESGDPRLYEMSIDPDECIPTSDVGG